MALPVRVHRAAEPLHILAGVEPAADAVGRGVVVAREDFRVALRGNVPRFGSML